ncbi:MAG: pilus assembly protein PilP [Candidatus Binatia bacterium]
MNRWLLPLTLAGIVALSGIGAAQDEKDAPSQKTREAIDKFKKAPEVIGKNLEELRGAVTGKTGQRPESEAKAPATELLDVPEKKSEPTSAPRYSSAGKRDPFQALPLKTQTKRRSRENLSPLERYDLGALKLVGIVWDTKDPRAMVEDSAGLGYVVRIGTPIGPNDGKIKEIKASEVVIEESYVDFYGARKNRRVSMRIVSE